MNNFHLTKVINITVFILHYCDEILYNSHIAVFIFITMYLFYLGKKLRNKHIEFVEIKDYLDDLIDLQNDTSIPKEATNLVFMCNANDKKHIDSNIIYSIFRKKPKRADTYWFVHVDVVDEPYRMDYKVIHIAEDDIIRVDFRLGFRVAPRINLMFRKVVEDLVSNKEVDIRSRYDSLNKNNISGDFKFVVIEKYLSYDNELPIFEKLILNAYYFIKPYSLSEAKAFGLDSSSVKVEKFPMLFKAPKMINLKRIE